MSTSRRKTLPANLKTLGDRRVESIISTGSVDRQKDTLNPNGWKLDNYRRSPVVLWAHDATQPPVAKSVQIGVVGGALRSVDEFPPPGVYPLADTVFELIRGGFINSKSVGFGPLKATPNAGGGWDFQEQELFEQSYVSVPANPEALVQARGAPVDQVRYKAWLGVDTSGETLTPTPAELVEAFADIRRDPKTVEDIRQDLAQQLARAIRRQVGEQVARLRGRVWDDLDHEAEIRELRLNSTVATLDDLPVSLDALKAELRGALREVLQAEVDQQLRRLTGRVD